MNLNTRQRAIITGALTDIERLKRKRPRTNAFGQCLDIAERDAIEHASSGVVRTDPARWLGHGLSPGDYVMLSRCYKSLETAGLIRRHRMGFGGVGFTHIEITPAGVDAVKSQEATTEPAVDA